ncbi:MAG: transposase [Clostridiaceae bacterium]
MARCARFKTNDAIFHVMIKSIPEINLFGLDCDKEMYLDILKFYQQIYHFKVYSYCLMSNHGHFIIDCNGADISRVMHSINFKYALNFNKKHNRNGHLFRERFKSKVINSERYLLTASAYIHRNPVDIIGYKDSPENYKYSSLAVYLGLRNDPKGILDEDFVMQLFSSNVKKARKKYKKFIYLCDDKKLKYEEDYENTKKEYSSDREIITRDWNPQEILKFISNEIGVECISSLKTNDSNIIHARAVSAVLLRGLCNLTCSDISQILGDIPLYMVSKLCRIGVKILYERRQFENVLNNFIPSYSS